MPPALGADHVLNNRTGDVVGWAREITDGAGVRMVFDHVGTALFAPSLFALGVRGRLVTCGNSSGDQATIPSLGYVFHSGITIMGSDPYRPEEFGPVWNAVLRAALRGRDRLRTSRSPTPAQRRRSCASNDFFGKILLRP